MADGSKVTITYCTQCNWLLRASWMAGELLQTFAAEVGEVALRPGTGGIFRVEAHGRPAGAADAADGAGAANGADGAGSDDRAADSDTPAAPPTVQVWDRKEDGGFPDIVDLKRRVRDVIAPELILGHADRAAAKAAADQDS